MPRDILEIALEQYLARQRKLVQTIPAGEARERLRRHVEAKSREAFAKLPGLGVRAIGNELRTRYSS
jgi:predicted transcriptional regulator